MSYKAKILQNNDKNGCEKIDEKTDKSQLFLCGPENTIISQLFSFRPSIIAFK